MVHGAVVCKHILLYQYYMWYNKLYILTVFLEQIAICRKSHKYQTCATLGKHTIVEQI